MPNSEMLKKDLGYAKNYLDVIGKFIENESGNVTFKWRFYGKKSGWLLKVGTNGRNIFFIVPQKNCFRTLFTFGERAYLSILKTTFPNDIKEGLRNAKKYAEGRTLQLSLKTPSDVKIALELVRIKLSN